MYKHIVQEIIKLVNLNIIRFLQKCIHLLSGLKNVMKTGMFFSFFHSYFTFREEN